MRLSLLLLCFLGRCCLSSSRLYEYHYVDKEMNWTAARDFCRSEFTDLATVTNMSDALRVAGLAKPDRYAWIGLNRVEGTERRWNWTLPGLQYDNNETNWADNEPNGGNGENCGALYPSYSVLDLSCEKFQPFICYNETSSSQFIVFNDTKTFWAALEFCRHHHTDMASGVEQLGMKGKEGKLKPELQQLNLLSGFTFIGLFKDSWMWSDRSGFSFRRWNPQYNSTETNNNCTAVNKTGMWSNKDCGSERNFICYRDRVHLIQQNLSWEDALYYCRERNQDLVTIRDLGEQRWVQEKVKSAATAYVWTGLRYTCTLGFWFWVSDERVGYQNWASSPAQVDGCGVSGAVDRGGKHQWVKKNDQEKLNFLCSDV